MINWLNLVSSKRSVSLTTLLAAALLTGCGTPSTTSSSQQNVPSSSSSIASSTPSSRSSSSSSSADNLITTRPASGAKQVNVGGGSRSYNMYVPSSYPTDRRVPLVIRFHGLGGSGGGEINSTGYRQIADREGFILVAPTGAGGSIGGAWNVGPCCTSDRNIDDVAFTRAIIEQVKSVANIDEKRIYATGFSMGGGMTHYLACHAADVIAAFAPEAFDLLQENVNQCNPSRAVPLLSQRSSNDSLVVYNGGQDCLTGVCINFLGAVGTNNIWKQKSGCTNQTSQQGSCTINTECTDGVEVGLCTLSNGHSPASADTGWNFLKQFSLP